MNASKGADLERRVGRVEFGDGSLVRLRWPVPSPADSMRAITDVDVLAIDFDSRLRPQVSIIECKSIRGQAGEQDRLLWLTGLRRVVGAQRAVLARETASRNGRELAKALGIELISEPELEAREQEHKWLPNNFAMIGDSIFSELDKRASRQLKSVGTVPAPLLSFLRNDSLLAAPYRIVGALSTLSEVVEKGSVLPEPAGQVVASHAFQALLIAAIKSASQIDAIGIRGVREQIEESAFVGDPGDRRIIRILRLADALLRDQASRLHKAYVESGARPITWSIPRLADELNRPPQWLERYCDLALRLRRRPHLSRQLPQTADLLLYDALAGDQNWKVSAFDHLFTVEHRQLILVAFDLLSAISPSLGDYIGKIQDVPFNRVPPVPADRSQPPIITSDKQLDLPVDVTDTDSYMD